MNATLQVKEKFNQTGRTKIRLTSNQVERYNLTRTWSALDISQIIGQLLQPYHDAVSIEKGSRNWDPLEAVGQTEMLRKFLNGGKGIPQWSLDELLITMVDTGSLSGVKICMDAGADANVFHDFHGSSAVDRALSAQRHDMCDAMAVREACRAGVVPAVA